MNDFTIILTVQFYLHHHVFLIQLIVHNYGKILNCFISEHPIDTLLNGITVDVKVISLIKDECSWTYMAAFIIMTLATH